eukprot:5969609-Pyramimonas_sp.AAC.1
MTTGAMPRATCSLRAPLLRLISLAVFAAAYGLVLRQANLLSAGVFARRRKQPSRQNQRSSSRHPPVAR